MKLRVFVTPQKHVLAPEASGLARALAPADSSRIADSATERIVELELGGLAEDERGAAGQACADIGQALAGSAVTVRCELSGAPGNAAAARSEAAAANAANTAFQDLDPSMLQAALPKLLAERPAVQTRAGALDERTVLVHDVARAVGSMPDRSVRIAIAESLRTAACMGALPRGFGVRFALASGLQVNGMIRWRDAVRAMREAADALGVGLLDFDVAAVDAASMPVTIGVSAVGTLPDGQSLTPAVISGPGQSLVLLGEAPNEIAGSRFVEVFHGLVSNDEPEIDLSAEKRLHKALLALVSAGVVTAARPLAAGGLLVAVTRMLLANERTFGARLDLMPLGGSRADALVFGESQSRAVVAVASERVGTLLAESHMRGVPAALLGEVTDGETLALKTRSMTGEWPLAELRAAAG